MTPKRTAEDAYQDLTDILTWRSQIPDPFSTLIGLHSTAYQVDPVRGSRAEDSLPFGLDAAYDEVDPYGPTGVRTNVGVEDMLQVLAEWASDADFHPGPVNSAPGPWIKLKLEMPYSWEDWADWDEWASDLATLRSRVAQLTGRGSQAIAPCPQCGGTLRARMLDPKKGGREDQAKCTDCGIMLDGLDFTNQFRTAAQDCTSPNVYVTADELKLIFEGIDMRKIRVWKGRGRIHINTKGHYRLTDVIACVLPQT